MTLTWPVALAVLFGALLHASWNALVKSSTDKEMDTALIHMIGSLMAIPLVLLVGWPPRSAWPFLVASITIHIGYYIALTGAYRHGELGLTYPLMRGVAPLLVALSASVTLGEQLSVVAWLGVLGISLGVLVLGLSQHAFDAPKAVAFALANAVIIAIYTVVDGLGVRAAGNTPDHHLAICGDPVHAGRLAVRADDFGPARCGAATLRTNALAVGVGRGTGVAGLLRHCLVGHDARARGHGRGAARGVGALCGSDWQCGSWGGTHSTTDDRCSGHHLRGDVASVERLIRGNLFDMQCANSLLMRSKNLSFEQRDATWLI